MHIRAISRITQGGVIITLIEDSCVRRKTRFSDKNNSYTILAETIDIESAKKLVTDNTTHVFIPEFNLRKQLEVTLSEI
jgi:hypothetical protein